ncbi:MAG: Acg family FMN-binding oxidoreductase [Sphingomonadaceae bacterium]
MNRRRLIASAGISALALVGGGVYWRVTRMPQSAFLPWSIGKSVPADVRLDAFRYAILAPNPHNRQPWLIKLIGNDSAIISCDLAKRLPETDPFDRQITIGFGCFLELAHIAAAQRGVRMETALFPDGEPQPRLDKRSVASVKFVADPGAISDPLFPFITKRRSNKEVYDLSKPVALGLARKVAGPGDGAIVDVAAVAAIRDQIVEAMLTEQTTRRTYMESVRLMRIGHTEIDSNPDGIDLGGPMMEGLKLAGQLDRTQLSDPQSATFKAGLDSLTATYGSVPALIWIKTPTNSRADQIEAGRRYVRANLRATQLGVDMHPMSQSLQEYAEVSKSYTAVHELLGARGEERIQMLARIGFGTPVDPAPRWPLETHLI